ncbi:MAG: hypothetical protein K9L21_03730 [Spirochaetia bacterium]|nr:hypothetical protein [Spirochaetia bacterium]
MTEAKTMAKMMAEKNEISKLKTQLDAYYANLKSQIKAVEKETKADKKKKLITKQWDLVNNLYEGQKVKD